MNVSFNSQRSYAGYPQDHAWNHVGSKQKNSHVANTVTALKNEQTRDLMQRLKMTKKSGPNPFEAYSKDRLTGYAGSNTQTKADKAKKAAAKVKYNFKEVASKIQRAKTSVSAGQAVLSAKRKVLEVKRKISSGQGDAEELQLALTHAKRMEMVARKKKHHLQLEELVVTTQRRDENSEQREDVATSAKQDIVMAEEQKVEELEDEIFDEREEMLDEAVAELEESNEEVTDEMMAELNEMISEFGEEELKQLEEAMEMLETMEIIDPHMSEEDLEELKRKHRSSEARAMMKADMDYLKSMIKYQTMKAAESMESAKAVPVQSMTPAVVAVPQIAGAESAYAQGAAGAVPTPSVSIQV